jgi:adenine deaminase
LEAESFRLTHAADKSQVFANAVVIETETTSLTGLERVPVRLVDGYPQFTNGDALALVSVITRNQASQCVGIVKKLGLESGAYASSFAHDSHNLVVVGRDAKEMSVAANLVREIGGGIVVVRNYKPIAVMKLPVFGLLSDDTLPNIVRDSQAIDDALRLLGVKSRRPFLMLSLLALSVSPNFKFTDKGVIDTERRQLLPMWVAAS